MWENSEGLLRSLIVVADTEWCLSLIREFNLLPDWSLVCHFKERSLRTVSTLHFPGGCRIKQTHKNVAVILRTWSVFSMALTVCRSYKLHSNGSSYRAVNTRHRCLSWHPCKTHKYLLCQNAQLFFFSHSLGTYTYHGNLQFRCTTLTLPNLVIQDFGGLYIQVVGSVTGQQSGQPTYRAV